MAAKCVWLKDSNKTIKGEVSVECWEQWARPEYNIYRERNSVCCWNGSLTHFLIHLGVLQARLTHSNPFFLLLYHISVYCLEENRDRGLPLWHAHEIWYVHCLKWKDTHTAAYIHNPEWRSCTQETPHLSVSFSASLGCRRGALFEGNANFPPVCERLEREKDVSKERVKDGDERGGGNAIEHTGCKVNNGEDTAKQLKIDLPCFWLPSAPLVSLGNTSPGWNTDISWITEISYISIHHLRTCVFQNLSND